nr:kinesin heavy chain isoform X1 [Parasteatoda tepidariorum]
MTCRKGRHSSVSTSQWKSLLHLSARTLCECWSKVCKSKRVILNAARGPADKLQIFQYPSSMASQQNTSIKVCCRIREQNEKDKEALVHSYEFRDEKSMLHLHSDKVYTFDQIFDPNSSQEQVYDDVAKPIVASVLTGYNGTIFAYGQTSSGKTYTMEGDLSDTERLGIIPRVAHDIFNQTESFEDSIKFEIKISFYEIYLEKIFDLLSDSQKESLFVYEDKKRIPFIRGLREITVRNVEDLMKFFNKAKHKRHVVATDHNRMSSRSHAVFQIVIKQENSADRKIITGKLLLVDLAGSERAGQSDVNGSKIRIESSYINKSLSVLSRVIFVLTSNTKDLPPYRESCLTRLLKESLGGNSQTVIIVCVRPSSESETKYSLEFGTRAKIIKNNLRRNVKLSENKMSRLQKYISIANKYIKNCATELQRWRSGETVPEEEWIPPFDYSEGDTFSKQSLRDSARLSSSQILPESSIFNTPCYDLNESLQSCEDISDLDRQLDIMRQPFPRLSLENTMSMQAENEKVRDMDENYEAEMVKLKEELFFSEEQILILHQDMETITQELKLQKERNEELSNMLITENKKKKTHETKAECCMQDLYNFKRIMNECLALLNQKMSEEINANFNSPKSLPEVNPEIAGQLNHITGKVLKETLSSEDIQNQIFMLFAHLQRLSRFHIVQEQKIAAVSSERDSADEKIISLQNELCNLNTSHAAKDQALQASILEKLQHLKTEGLQESLRKCNIQNNIIELCDQLINLSEKCDLQEQKIAAVTDERDSAVEKNISFQDELCHLNASYAAKDQALQASIDEKLQHLKIEGLQESLRENNIQNNIIKLCDWLIKLFEECDLKDQKILELSKEKDSADEKFISLQNELCNLEARHAAKDQALQAISKIIF